MPGTTVYIGSGWYRDIEKLRQMSASLINSHRDEILIIEAKVSRSHLRDFEVHLAGQKTMTVPQPISPSNIRKELKSILKMLER